MILDIENSLSIKTTNLSLFDKLSQSTVVSFEYVDFWP